MRPFTRNTIPHQDSCEALTQRVDAPPTQTPFDVTAHEAMSEASKREFTHDKTVRFFRELGAPLARGFEPDKVVATNVTLERLIINRFS